MKICITGASGSIGRYVLAELMRQQVEVVVVTRDATQFSALVGPVRIVEMDISVADQNSFVLLGRPDILIHLAWDGLHNYMSLHHFETELPRQFSFLKAMIEAGLPSLLVTGTCLEYGMQSGPFSEELVTVPSTPYGFAKDALRQQLQYLQIVKQFHLIWARLFYMYGEGQSTNSLYSQLKDAVSKGAKVFNMSGGEQLRDYLPINEVARLITVLAKLQRDIGCVNICSGQPISVRKLVERWLLDNQWDIDLNLGYYPYPDYEPMAFWGDRMHLTSILDTQ